MPEVASVGGLFHFECRMLAQMLSVDRIELRLSLEAKRKTSTRGEYFAF